MRAIGQTPLIPLRRLGRGFPGVKVFAKAEWFNPGGSVKDRPAYRMIRAEELKHGGNLEKILLDATSGNTGIAYAMIGARRGYRIKLLMPANASPERKRLLNAYGAELELTDPAEGSDGAFYQARRLFEEHPDRYFYPDQYGNPQNPLSHYETTGPEILWQTQGEITHFVAGLGTSGTMMGTGRCLREYNPQVRLVSIQPDGPFHGLEGLKHMDTASHVPELYDRTLPDQVLGVNTEAAQDMAKRLAREEGLYVGVSAGAAVAGALRLAAEIGRGTIVALCPDGGARYQSEEFWQKQ